MASTVEVQVLHTSKLDVEIWSENKLNTTPADCSTYPVLDECAGAEEMLKVIVPKTRRDRAYTIHRHIHKCIYGATFCGRIVERDGSKYVASKFSQQVCIKVIQKASCPSGPCNENPRKEIECLQYLKQKSLMNQASHTGMGVSNSKSDYSRLVRIIDCCEDILNYYVIMPLFVCDLFTVVKNRNCRLSETDCVVIVSDIVRGLSELHGAGLVHHDIALENIMIAGNSTNTHQINFDDSCVDIDALQALRYGGHAVIIDFGMVVKVAHGQRLKNGSKWPAACGRPAYLPPELLAFVQDEKKIRHHESESWAHSSFDPFKVDIWALGVIMLVLISGGMPWDARIGPTREQIMFFRKGGLRNLISCWKLADTISCEAVDLLERLLDTNPDTRWSISKVSSHPWLRNELCVASKKHDSIYTGSPIVRKGGTVAKHTKTEYERKATLASKRQRTEG